MVGALKATHQTGEIYICPVELPTKAAGIHGHMSDMTAMLTDRGQCDLHVGGAAGSTRAAPGTSNTKHGKMEMNISGYRTASKGVGLLNNVVREVT